MDASIELDRNGLLAAWRRLIPAAEGVGRDRYELNEFGEVVPTCCPSGTRQLAFTDIYCQLTDQLGHLAAMSVPVLTPSFGIRVPDVVWMAPEKWDVFGHDGPVPFVPDLCVEVLLDSDPSSEMGRRVASYLEGGATEVVVVTPHGDIEFWGAEGRRQASILALSLSLEPVLCHGSVSLRTAARQVCGDLREPADWPALGRNGPGHPETVGVAANGR